MSDVCFQCGKTLPLTKEVDAYLFFCGDSCYGEFSERHRTSKLTPPRMLSSLKVGIPPAVTDAMIMLERKCDGNEQAEEALDVLRKFVHRVVA